MSLSQNDNTGFYETLHDGEGAVIAAVSDNSPAERAGLESGCVIVSLNGVAPRDILDWYWASDEQSVDVEYRDLQGDLHETELQREWGQEWGIEFESLVFDKVRRCANDCAFCFMTQLPRGMRSSLYLKDDDYRLSFLQGNFITLTNLGEEDIERIKAMNISPLNVSFHASNDEVRRILIGRNAPTGKANFIKLAEAGIKMNVQIVLVPECNDKEILDETIEWLSAYHDAIPSIGIVPVAFTNQTKEIAGKPPVSFTKQLDAARVIEQVQRHQFKHKAEHKTTWIHLADEFYIYAKAPFPQEEWYDGFPQYENGIGIVWGFVDEIRENFQEFTDVIAQLPEMSEAVTLVIGELATESFIGALTALNAGGKVRILPVKNRFFGGNVTVTGLLTGTDISEAINYDAARNDKPTTYLVPRSIFNADGLTLDDWTQEDIENHTEAPVRFHETNIPSLIESIRSFQKEV